MSNSSGLSPLVHYVQFQCLWVVFPKGRVAVHHSAGLLAATDMSEGLFLLQLMVKCRDIKLEFVKLKMSTSSFDGEVTNSPLKRQLIELNWLDKQVEAEVDVL